MSVDDERDRLATIAESACRLLAEQLDSLRQRPRLTETTVGRIRALSLFLSAPGHEVPGLRDQVAARDRSLDACQARIAELLASHPKCADCGRPASCCGSYGDVPAYACDTCCGHGCEDGKCVPLVDVPAWVETIDLNISRIADERDELRAALRPTTEQELPPLSDAEFAAEDALHMRAFNLAYPRFEANAGRAGNEVSDEDAVPVAFLRFVTALADRPLKPEFVSCGWCVRAAGDDEAAWKAAKRYTLEESREHAVICEHHPLVGVRDVLRARLREVERFRDTRLATLNRIADRLGVVHEDDKILAAFERMMRERNEARQAHADTQSALVEVAAELDRLAAIAGTFDKRCADALADEVAVLVRRKVIDARSPAADALLDYREPPSTPRADRLAEPELKPEEHADMRRVLQLMIHLDGKNQRTGEWGDDLASAVAVVNRIVAAHGGGSCAR